MTTLEMISECARCSDCDECRAFKDCKEFSEEIKKITEPTDLIWFTEYLLKKERQ